MFQRKGEKIGAKLGLRVDEFVLLRIVDWGQRHNKSVDDMTDAEVYDAVVNKTESTSPHHRLPQNNRFFAGDPGEEPDELEVD